jgi:RHS repeat-associated protein
MVTTVVPGGAVAQATSTPVSKVKVKPATPAVGSTQDVVSAMMTARKQKSRVEIMADRTAFAQTFANPNGTLTYVSYAQPRWVQQGSSWTPVDPTLVRNKDGSWSPSAAETRLIFSGGGSAALATVGASGQSLAISWPSRLPVPSVSGPTATYPNVLPGVNLVLTATATGAFDETLVVENAAASKDPGLADLALKVSLSPGLSQSVDKSGNVVVKNAKGQVLFTSPAPEAWDSTAASGSGATSASSVRGPGRGARTAKISATYGAGTVRMSLPATLRAGSADTFPVYMDPSYTVSQAWGAYDETQSAYPTTEEYNATYNGDVSVGYDGGGIDRGYYQFGLPSAADGATVDVLSATMSTEVVSDYESTSQSHTVDAYYTSQVSSSNNWNSPPTQLAGPTAQTFTTTSTTPDQTVNFNVASYVQTELDAYGWQFSAELANSSETASAQFVEFSNDPTLSITYDHAPWAPGTVALSPQNYSPAGQLYTSSLTPTLQASTTDADGDQVAYQFQVEQGSTVVESGTSGYYASGATGSWTVPTALSNDTAYAMYVRGYDGTEYGNWTGPYDFTTDSGTPAAPSVSCSGYPSGTWTALVSGGTTCTFSDSSPLIGGYVYELQNGSGSPTWAWTASGSVTVDPTSNGLYTLTVTGTDDAGVSTSSTTYSFGIGVDGAMLTPADQSQTSTIVSLQAAAPSGYTSATFEYRVGTTGSFTAIPSHVVVTSCGCSVTWPVSTSSAAVGVQTALLNWAVTETLADDGPVQIEAVFTNSDSGTDTTSPVTVTLDRLGSGTDFGTTTVGPVTVGLQSGNAALSAADVSIASYGSDLSVSRTFNSLAPAAPSIFGPGWVSSLEANSASTWSSITDDSSYALVTEGGGSTYTFTAGTTSGGVTPYTGDGSATTAGLTLTKNTTASTFTLAESSGSATTFAVNGSTSNLYTPTTATSPGSSKAAGYVYDAVSTDANYGKPLLMVAPDAASSAAPTTACPSPASSTTWTSAGCRGLQFDYDATTGNVSEIDFVYVDNSGTFHSVAVAKYTYDTSGRLVSEWDPRLSTPLVTGYTYDETSTDANYGRITQVSPAQAAGSSALASVTLTYDTTSGDTNYGKLLTVARTHSSTYGGATATDTIDYSVPLTTAADGPVNMDPTTVATWGQADDPTSAVAVWTPSRVPASTPSATDYTYATIDYYDADGREVNTASYINGAWAVTTIEYDVYGNVVRQLTAADRATALASSSPTTTSQALDTENLYACDDFGTITACTTALQPYEVLTDTYGPAHTANVNGTNETVRTHVAYVYDASAPNSDTSASGTPFMLTTSQTVSASVGSTVPATTTADARTTEYVYANGTDTLGWTLGTPLKTITDPSGLAITKTAVFNESSSLYGGDNLTTHTYQPSTTSGGTAADTETVYYTAGTNTVDSSCGSEPAWANLPCKTEPAAQPGTSGLPSLAVTTYTYNVYLSALTETQTYGSTGTRTITFTYDAADRPLTTTVSVTGTGMGAAVPETRAVYSTNSGQSTDTQSLNSSGTVTADLATTYDDFGQPVTYTDAAGNESTYTYNIAGQVTSTYDGKGTDTITYSPGGLPTTEVDSQAGTFAATYNPDGAILTETYPDGTVGTRTTDPTGTATSLVYSNSNWASSLVDSVTTNAQGDWISQNVLNDSYAYTYDNDDRLTNVQDTQAGSCTTRAYTYDADTNRTGLTTYAAASGGACQDTTGTAETYTLDAADRLVSSTSGGSTSSYAYDTQGDVTTTPSVDAGGTGNLTATYYANGLLDSQTQSGNTDSWTLDPDQDRYSTWSDSANSTTYTNHYSDDGDSPAWTVNGSGGWTRNITGLDGQLAATETSGGVLTFELPDLHGDILATSALSGTGPAATFTYTEFGSLESTSSVPAEYGYLGGAQRSGQALGNTVLMGVRGYNSSTGRFDSPDPIPGGNANAYDYVYQNPLTGYDLNGEKDWTLNHSFGDIYLGLNYNTWFGFGTLTFYFGIHFNASATERVAGVGASVFLAGVGAIITDAVSAASGAFAPIVGIIMALVLAWATAKLQSDASRAHHEGKCLVVDFSMKTAVVAYVPLFPTSIPGVSADIVGC